MGCERSHDVVRRHDGHDGYVRLQRAQQASGPTKPIGVDRQMRDLCPGFVPTREKPTGFEDRGVLDRACDDVSGLAAGANGADQSEVVGFSAAGGEDDFFRLAPIRAATCARAVSTAARATRPSSCRLDGFPNAPPRNGPIASSTRGSSGVVAE